jgi:RND family efflux transporter MFP subunit
VNRSKHLIFACVLAGAGCNEPAAEADHGHSHDTAGHAHPHPHPAPDAPTEARVNDHGHAHAPADGASEAVTTWSEHTQLFVEFPALVVGEESPFAAHFTRLSDHGALAEGKVTVELSSSDAALESFEVAGPSVPGIFRPEVLPKTPGKRKVTLRFEGPAISETHELGEFTVFTSRAEANAAAPEAEDDGSISYLLEQQWKVPFRIAAVQAREIRPTVPAFGHLIAPAESESVVVAPSDGRVVGTNGSFPRVGQDFEEGAQLFSLAPLPHEGADRVALDAALDQANIEVAAAKREVDRLTPLLAQGVVSQRRVDEAQSALDQARAKQRGAKRGRAKLTQAQRVGKANDGLTVPAPIDGTVAQLHVSPGTWVSEGDPLARVVNRENLVLAVGMPEAYIGQLRKVSGAWFRLDNVAEVIDLPASQLLSVGTEVDPETGTLHVRFRVPNLERKYFAGMSTQAHLVVDEPRLTLAVPISAVIEEGGHDQVFVQLGGESFERRPVKLGVRDGDYVEVLSGIEPGEWVVSQGAHGVKLASTSTAAIGHGHAH